MNLTPIDSVLVPTALSAVRARLSVPSLVSAAFDHIAETAIDMTVAHETPAHRKVACDLVRATGMLFIDEAPADAFSWDGMAVRTRSEASVLIHEVAHWLIAPACRRSLPDFGLGAGPETGWVAMADATRCVDDTVREEEELLASLLGILIEATLGMPAIHAFIEQNWLEAWERPAAAEQFCVAARKLFARGLINTSGQPSLFQDGSAAIAAISIKNSGQANADTSTIADAGPSFGK